MRFPAFLLALLTLCLATGAHAAERQSTATDYDLSVSRLERTRELLAKSYRKAASAKERNAILDRAGVEVLRALSDEILPAWYGTPWEFSGTTAKPREGAIACGTFVGTVMAHAGFRLNRIAMGRLASEHIALSLTSERNLRRYSNRPVRVVKRDVQEWGPGLYVVGLDMHAGLLLVKPDKTVHFIHSSFYTPSVSVVSEPVLGDNPFANSKYRVLAKLFDRPMMRSWLLEERFVARKHKRRRASRP